MRAAIRISFAVLVTTVWLGVWWYYAWHIKRPETLLSLRPNEMGDFLAGSFAPLAFFWFVIAYLQQGQELRSSTEALKKQSEELEKAASNSRRQAELSEAAANISQRDVVLRMASIIFLAMNNNLRDLIKVCEAASESDLIDLEVRARSGDTFSFASYLLSKLGVHFSEKLVQLRGEAEPEKRMSMAMAYVIEKLTGATPSASNLVDQCYVQFNHLMAEARK